MEDPIFLVAPVRSGSTLLRLMLDAHPLITNPGECDFLLDMVSDYGIIPEMQSYHDFLTTNRIFLAKKLQLDPALGYQELMNSFASQFRKDGTVLIMNVHRHFHRMPFIFPHAKYIHLQRDPRDVARSCVGMGWAGNVYHGVDIWIEAEKSWNMLKPLIGNNQYIEIKYEDLLSDTEGGLTSLCGFLGLPYSPQMVEYNQGSSYEKPNKNLMYQWRRKYSARELQLVEGKLGSMLSDKGYEASGVTPVIPNAIEKMWLKLDNKKFKIAHSLNRYGVILYLKNLLSRKLGVNSLRTKCQIEINRIDQKYLK